MLLAFMTVIWGAGRASSLAQLVDDAPVCGDAETTGEEECDDGNLRNGDRCSSECKVEACNNGRIEGFEQCDGGPRCDDQCFLTFCGDNIVQEQAGEQCDDGDRTSGDGCSSICKLENQPVIDPETGEPVTPDTPVDSPAPTPAPAPAPVAAPVRQSPAQSTAISTLRREAGIVTDFLFTSAGEVYTAGLSDEQNETLALILDLLRQGKPLTPELQQQAGIIAAAFIVAKADEHDKYSNAIRGFFLSDSGQQMLGSLGIDPAIAGTDTGLAEIEKILAARPAVSSEEKLDQVDDVLKRLDRQSVDLNSALTARFQTIYANENATPVQQLKALSALREDLERQAQDPAKAMPELHGEIGRLRDSIPQIEKEFGAETAQQVNRLLIDLEALAKEGKPADAPRAAASLNRIAVILEQKGVARAEIEVADTEYLHAAATVEVAAAAAGLEVPADAESQDPLARVQSLAAQAPAAYAYAFANGRQNDQVQALLRYLDNNTRILELRDIVRQTGNNAMDVQFEQLRREITQIGMNDARSECSYSIEAATDCVQTYVTALEQAARNRSALSKAAAALREYFGIEQ